MDLTTIVSVILPQNSIGYIIMAIDRLHFGKIMVPSTRYMLVKRIFLASDWSDFLRADLAWLL